MGYDPANPATWSISQLRLYATEHNISIPSGCEKSELVALVDECMTNVLLAEHIRKENVLDDAVLPDLLAATTDTILRHQAYPSYAATLRQHPKKLEEIIHAGLHQLESLIFVARLCGVQLLSPLSAWLEQVAHAEDGGTSFQAAFTPAEGSTAVSAVCGRFCGDGDMVVRCLDCGADPTCVMCMDCFRHSPCVNHRYRITQGSGGGMCDCGDPTAWKPASFCSRHRPAATGENVKGGDGGASVSSNPVDVLAEENREWVTILLRGIIQYISLSILQYLRICEAQKRAKSLEKAKTPPQAAPMDPEAALMEDVTLIASTYNWLSGWLTPVTNRLWELMSTTEVAKQIVAQLWTEPLYLSDEPTASLAADLYRNEEAADSESSRGRSNSTVPSAKQKDVILAALPDNFSCLHPVFLFETLRPVTDRETPLKGSTPDPWYSTLAKCIGHCLSVSKLRMPVGALMATYAECINACVSADDDHYALHDYQVQVLTNPDVLQYLMTPSHMPYKNATNTVVHRELSSILYTLCVNIDRGPRNAIQQTASVATDGLIFIEHQNEFQSYGGIAVLNYCLSSLPTACYTLVLNRLAWRSFVKIHGTLAISGYIYANPNAPTDSSRFPAPDFFARILSRHTWLWFHAIRATVAALVQLPVEAGTDNSSAPRMPHISPSQLSAALQIPQEMWQRWAEATRFDAPPDVSRRRRVFMQMLGNCKVQNGPDEALLILQDGALAAAQMAAIQQHMGEAERKGNPGAHGTAATPVMSASLVAAIGYAVQLLYEVSRTMDNVFQKQRDGFCQRCHTIALERENRPDAVAVVLPEAGSPLKEEEQQETEGMGKDGCRASAAESAVSMERERNEDEARGSSLRLMSVSSTLPPSQGQIDVFEYNLLQPSQHATTFSNHLQHIFGAVLTAWVIEQQRYRTAAHPQRRASAARATTRLSGLCDDAAPTSPSPSSSACLARPLHTLLDCFFKLRAKVMPHLVQDRLTFCQQLLDSLVMPQVLIGQVFDGLWRRNNYGVSATVTMYLKYSCSVAAEFDILMLQVLTMELAPADMAIQILRRFSYTKQRLGGTKKTEETLAALGDRKGSAVANQTRHLAFYEYLKGYKHYLRLMLTLVVDTTKAAFHPPLSSHCMERTVAHFLAKQKASHSTITQVVSDFVRGGDFGLAEEDEKDMNGNVIRVTQVIDAAVKKLAVAQDSSRGKQFRLRDVQTWKTYVSLYQSSILDAQLEEVHKNYRSVALASRAATLSVDEDDDGSNNNNTNRYALPPTQLSDDAMYAELLPTTRALLHTDALLLPALYVLHEYVNAHTPLPPPPPHTETSRSPLKTPQEDVRSPRSDSLVAPPDADASGFERSSHQSSHSFDEVNGGDGDTDTDSEDDDESANLITRETLLHAVTALYLCVQDCRSITRAMQAVEHANDDPTSSAGNESKNVILWDLVELYLQRYRVNELSFTADSCAQVLPLPELLRHRTLLHKLQTHVRLRCRATATAKATTVRVTSADMLHRLRQHLHSNKDADIYSCLEMVEEVLVLTGLATFGTPAATAEQQLKEAARSRKKLIQERQAKLMQRMRSRVLKTAVDQDASPASAPTSAADRSEQDAQTSSFLSTKTSAAAASTNNNVAGSLLTKVLVELATLDCCVCRATTEEPLFLLCHTSTSSVLPQLGALTLPDRRGVHNHLCICGHAAHKTCVEKLFVRLSVLWQRWNFRSQMYLGPTEFNCPLCNMIVTTLAPVPSQAAGATNLSLPSGPTPFTSLFEELQSGTFHPNNRYHDRTEDVVVEFQTNLAHCAVGFSLSEDIPALVATEDPLQKTNEAAWIMSESMRTFFYSSHLLLEGVKVGQAISHRDLISLLSLLVSLMPAKLQAAQAALRNNFEATKKDQDSLLLLDALLRPREAAQLICAHVLAHVLPNTSHEYLHQLLARAQHAKDEKDVEEEVEAPPSTFQAATEKLEADFPGTTMVMWRAVGVLTLLKALLVEDASHAIILSRNSFTVAGTVTFTTLHPTSIATPAARCTAILRMLQYLLPVPHKSATESLQVVALDLLKWIAHNSATSSLTATTPELFQPGTLLYTGADAYVEQISEKLLHLPRVYANVLTAFAAHKLCFVCHREATNPVLCCHCGQHMCMRRHSSDSSPELYQHVRACGGAVGLFLAVRLGTLYVMELMCGRLYALSSNYTDEYGEHDRNLRRGVPLFRNLEETHKLVDLWMQNKWGVVSAVFGNSNRVDLTEL